MSNISSAHGDCEHSSLTSIRDRKCLILRFLTVQNLLTLSIVGCVCEHLFSFFLFMDVV